VTMVSAPPTVTCVVITKNEERNHQDCLQSVHWVVEDAVIESAAAVEHSPLEVPGRIVRNVVDETRDAVANRVGRRAPGERPFDDLAVGVSTCAISDRERRAGMRAPQQS